MFQESTSHANLICQDRIHRDIDSDLPVFAVYDSNTLCNMEVPYKYVTKEKQTFCEALKDPQSVFAKPTWFV